MTMEKNNLRKKIIKSLSARTCCIVGYCSMVDKKKLGGEICIFLNFIYKKKTIFFSGTSCGVIYIEKCRKWVKGVW